MVGSVFLEATSKGMVTVDGECCEQMNDFNKFQVNKFWIKFFGGFLNAKSMSISVEFGIGI